jgi:diguanylate cyclase
MGQPPRIFEKPTSKPSLVSITSGANRSAIASRTRLSASHSDIEAGTRGPRPADFKIEGAPHIQSVQSDFSALQLRVATLQKELMVVQEREKRLRYLALHDDLTALPNRRYFRERLGVALRQEGEVSPVLAVIFLDLDGFKALNDAHGHDTGDQLLSLVAARLAHAVRAEDLVSRLGGDEYACLITGVSSRERLQQITSTLFEAVAAPFKIGTLSLEVRPSMGIAVYPTDGTTIDALMNAADTAMYAAKRKRSTYSFSERPNLVPPSNSAAL